jgi:transcription elongation factor Elf1
MNSNAAKSITCSQCGNQFTVALDDTWEAVSSNTVTRKKLFRTYRVSELVWEKQIQCPSCHVLMVGKLNAEMRLGKLPKP